MTRYESRIPHAIPFGHFGAEVLVVRTHLDSPVGMGWPSQETFGPFADLREAERFLATRSGYGKRGVTLTAQCGASELNGGPVNRTYRVRRSTPAGPCDDLYQVFNG